MFNKLRDLSVIAAMAILMAVSSNALAQKPLRRYRPPAGPTITPYLNYSRADLSTLPDPYNSFVVPQQRLQRDLYETTRRQENQFRTLENQLDQVKNSTVPPTGVGSTFMNYSHYYQNRSSRAARY